MVDARASVRHPIGQQLAHAGPVLDPHADAVPQAAVLLALAHHGVAVGRHLEQAVEGAALVVAESAEDGRELDGALQGSEDVLHVEVALRGRDPGFGLAQQLARVAEAGGVLLIIAPLDHAALGGRGIPRVAHVGRVALVAHQRPADVLARPGELVEGPEEHQRVVDRHHGQILARHLGDHPSPQPGADHDVVGRDRAARGDDAADAAAPPARARSPWCWRSCAAARSAPPRRSGGRRPSATAARRGRRRGPKARPGPCPPRSAGTSP